MRSEAKKEREVKVIDIEGYHCGSHAKNLVFASDRPVEADSNYRLLSDGSLMALFGIEVETQNWGIKSQKIYANVLKGICFQNFHPDLWKIEEDGSLRGNSDSSAECISQPMTKAYIRNHYRDFKAMFEWFEALGIKCDKTGDCGMHTHISTTCFGRSKAVQDEAIKKFVYIINRHYDLMMKLVYRRPDADGSTFYFRQRRFSKAEVKNMELRHFPNDHHSCINLGHYLEGNIELRLVGGQKNFPCFRNTMESVFHLVEVSKNISWADADNIVKIFEGCNNYVFNRLATYVKQANLISDSELDAIRPTVVNKQFI